MIACLLCVTQCNHDTIFAFLFFCKFQSHVTASYKTFLKVDVGWSFLLCEISRTGRLHRETIKSEAS